ncbi:MAG: hypothetical protein EZS28_008051 [Streblomastix strix]|uniref:Uncharacterized protein n=1 Tax=Streblomastix strix TaxID=222440 RepID=A0A5J4WQR4_9EUKA|nr:MAG: hypothetical protein EZS28_008051 [Streblomastix strix]
MKETIKFFHNSYDEDLQNYRKEQEIEKECEREREKAQCETNERLQRMAERLQALEQELDINIVDFFKTVEEELWEMINLYKHGRIIDYGDPYMILLTQPINMELLYEVVDDFRDRMADEVVITAEKSMENTPTIEFYKNDIKNYQDCDKFLDKVFEQEGKRPFKISFDFGTVIQRSEPKSQTGNKVSRYSIVDDQSNKIVSYRINRPEVNKTVIHIPSIIMSKQNINDYKKYIRSTIIQMQERTKVDTQEMFVAIISMLICVYRLPYNSAGLCNECLKIHKNRKEIRYVDCDYNYMICFWTALTHLIKPDRKGEFIHPTSRVALAKKELFKYYNVK